MGKHKGIQENGLTLWSCFRRIHLPSFDRDFDSKIIGVEDHEWRKFLRPPKRKGVSWYGFDPNSAYLGGALYLASYSGQLVVSILLRMLEKGEKMWKRIITDGGEIILVNRDLMMRNDIYYYNSSNGTLRVLVAEVTGLVEDDFKTQFGDRRPWYRSCRAFDVLKVIR